MKKEPPIAAWIANSGSHTWTVTGPPTQHAVIQISDAADPAISDRSDATFGILEQAGSCVPGPTQLCLLGARFAAQVDWYAGGSSGQASAVTFSDQAGLFSFFSPDNLEVGVNLLDGGDYFWVFHSSLTTVQYTLTVTDTITGQVNTYVKPASPPGDTHLCGGGDTQAFPAGSGRLARAGAPVLARPMAATKRHLVACGAR